MAERVALALIGGVVSEIPASDTIRGAGSGSGYQKYIIAVGETYSIPLGVSSVITGPMENDGIVDVLGRLEIL